VNHDHARNVCRMPPMLHRRGPVPAPGGAGRNHAV